jgi:hypothetical protein
MALLALGAKAFTLRPAHLRAYSRQASFRRARDTLFRAKVAALSCARTLLCLMAQPIRRASYVSKLVAPRHGPGIRVAPLVPRATIPIVQTQRDHHVDMLVGGQTAGRAASKSNGTTFAPGMIYMGADVAAWLDEQMRSRNAWPR